MCFFLTAWYNIFKIHINTVKSYPSLTDAMIDITISLISLIKFARTENNFVLLSLSLRVFVSEECLEICTQRIMKKRIQLPLPSRVCILMLLYKYLSKTK